jgi:hypothetical protein
MSSDLENGLNEIEHWIDQDPSHLLTYMLSGPGFYSFWQLIVAAAYAEDEFSWKRLDKAAQRLSQSGSRLLLDMLVDQLLAKAETVCGITNEQRLFDQVRSLCLIFSPSSGLHN